MSFLLLRAQTPPCISLLLPQTSLFAPAFRSRAAAHLTLSSPTTTTLRALKPQPSVCPHLSGGIHPSISTTGVSTGPGFTVGLLGRFHNGPGQQWVRRYGTFDRRNWFDSQKNTGKQVARTAHEAQGLRLLDRLKFRGQLSDLQAPPHMTHTQRLLRPFLFTIAVCIASYTYSLYWEPPRLSERLFPNIPQSVATVGALIAANVAIFLLWKVPIPLNWRILNKYFVSIPALPNSPALLGAAFSHQSIGHLALNCFGLYVFGSTLCNQIGRGNFLAVYFTSAVVSSFTSLAYHVVVGPLNVYALGASGAVCGIVGAYAYFNPNAELTFLILPFISVKAAHFVGAMAGWEIWSLMRGNTKLDHVSHLSGLGTGVLYGVVMWHAAKKRGEKRIKRWSGERV